MIEINNLVKRYGKICAVDDISFTVRKGEIVGFLGPNGAGKSTTMNIINGCLASTSGSVKICGYDILENPMEAKAKIGFLPENPPLYMDMTVDEYLFFVAELKGVPKKEREQHIREICELIKIDHVRSRLVGNLSKGYRQRVGLAQAIVGNPEVLILDEPTVGLDPTQIIEIRNLIKKLSKKHTILLSSHILPEVSAVCDRIVIINKGKISAINTPDNLANSINKASTYSISVVGTKSIVEEAIRSVNGVKSLKVIAKKQGYNEFAFEIDEEVDPRRGIFFALAKLQCAIIELKPLDITLEDVFIHIVTNENFEQDKEGK